MGRFFLFREARPRGDILVTWGFERAKGNSTKTKFPLTDYHQSDSPS
jgi:hypothetical protein